MLESFMDNHASPLDWDSQGQPFSPRFQDRYFSRANGLAESRYVFLEQNQLADRFAALPNQGTFCIGETGFGTGLNFLCAWQLFELQAPSTSHLHYISVEKYPLSHADLARTLALWPELTPFASALLAQYQAIHPGFQRLVLGDGRVRLDLLIGEAQSMLGQLDAGVDAWFLDGFAPAKNPAMWSAELFQQLARLSADQATLATFTSAGGVRRGLTEAGFRVQKRQGFGHKREMLSGVFAKAPAPTGPAAPAPWYTRPPQAEADEALVIGAGLAGCASAASLAARGWKVRVLERRGAAAEEASGNPQGVLYLKLSAKETILSRLLLSGFGYTRRLLERLGDRVHWSACGVLQMAFDARESQRQQDLAEAFSPQLLQPLPRQEAEAIAGVELAGGGLFFPEGGWVNPASLCRALLDHPNIRLLTHTEVLQLQQDAAGHWHAWHGEQHLASAPVAVIANANEAKRFSATARLPVKAIRGQVSYLPSNPSSSHLNTVLCAQGYLAPAWQGQHTLGASFVFNSQDLTPTCSEHADNLQLLDRLTPTLRQGFPPPEALDGRAALRSTAPDYLPVVGPVADEAAFNQAFQALGKNARRTPQHPCPWLKGLYVNLAHGSRGLLSAPLAAELLAAWITAEPLPVARDIAEGCHPNRFVVRRLMRRQE